MSDLTLLIEKQKQTSFTDPSASPMALVAGETPRLTVVADASVPPPWSGPCTPPVRPDNSP